MTTNVAFETKLNYLSLQFINKSCLRWQRPERKTSSGGGITRSASLTRNWRNPRSSSSISPWAASPQSTADLHPHLGSDFCTPIWFWPMKLWDHLLPQTMYILSSNLMIRSPYIHTFCAMNKQKYMSIFIRSQFLLIWRDYLLAIARLPHQIPDITTNNNRTFSKPPKE